MVSNGRGPSFLGKVRIYATPFLRVHVTNVTNRGSQIDYSRRAMTLNIDMDKGLDALKASSEGKLMWRLYIGADYRHSTYRQFRVLVLPRPLLVPPSSH